MTSSLSFPLDIVKSMAESYVHFDPGEDLLIDVVMAVKVANGLNADPLWMHIIGPPASLKTETLSGLDGHQDVVMLSSLTAKTLISGLTVKGNNKSLLPKLNGKLLVLKDFTSVLTIRREARMEILSQMREVYDGKYDKGFGTGQTINWAGKVGILTGVTEVIDKYQTVNQMLGERFLHFRIRGGDCHKVAKMALNNTTGMEREREGFRWAVGHFLSQFEKDPLPEVSTRPIINMRLSMLSVFCAHARTAVARNYNTQTLQYKPKPEGPARLVKQFKLLATGLAIVRGQNEIDTTIYEVVKKVARDTIPQLRLVVLRALWKLYKNRVSKWHSTRDVSTEASIPKTTAKLILEDLSLLNLTDVRSQGGGKTAPQHWRPSKLMRKVVVNSGVFA